MYTTLENLLEEECKNSVYRIRELDPGSDEANWQLKKLGELHKMKIEEEKMADGRVSEFEETALKKKQAKWDKIGTIIKYSLEGIGTVGTLVGTSYWLAKGFKFEETGCYSARTPQWVSGIERMFKKK